MRDGREAGLTLVPGRKGGGKSHETEETIDVYSKGLSGIPARRGIILDVNNEFSKYPSLDLRDIKEWSLEGEIECRRIRPWHTYGPKKGSRMSLDDIKDSLKIILENFVRGVVLIEDINKYVQDAIPGDLFGQICTQRHVAVDVIIHFQTLARIGHPKLWPNANYIRMHRCDDSVSTDYGRYEGFEKQLRIMEELIKIKNKAGNPYYSCWLNKDDRKITGDFSKIEFMKAIETFFSEDYNRFVKPYVNRVNLNTGSKLFSDHGAAVDRLQKETFDEYYGNKK